MTSAGSVTHVTRMSDARPGWHTLVYMAPKTATVFSLAPIPSSVSFSASGNSPPIHAMPHDFAEQSPWPLPHPTWPFVTSDVPSSGLPSTHGN